MSAAAFGFRRFELPDGAELTLQPLQQCALGTATTATTHSRSCTEQMPRPLAEGELVASDRVFYLGRGLSISFSPTITKPRPNAAIPP